MFRRDPSKNPTTPVQKMLTYGLIFFMVYIYFTESKRVAEISNQPIGKTLKITNVISGEVTEFNPELREISLAIKAGDISKLKAKPVGKDDDLITVFEIEVAGEAVKDEKNIEEKVAPKAEKEVENKVEEKIEKKDTTKETKTDKKPSEKSNLDAKPVSN